VTVKKYRGLAYLRVPVLSGDLLDHGFNPAPLAEAKAGTSEEQENAATAGTVNSAGNVAGDAVQAGSYQDHRVTGVGSVGRDAHNVITGSQGPVHIGDGNSADTNTGRGRRRRRDS
jgi:hypothetical protein